MIQIVSVMTAVSVMEWRVVTHEDVTDESMLVVPESTVMSDPILVSVLDLDPWTEPSHLHAKMV